MPTEKLRKIRFWIALFVPALFFFFLRKDWLGFPLVDIGSELYIASRLNRGDRLYFELNYLYGPVAPYLQALGFKLLGESWSSFVLTNFAILLGTLYCLGRLAQKYIGEIPAIFTLLFSTFCFGFNQLVYIGNYNFLTPYRPALPIALLSSLLSLNFFAGTFENRSKQKKYFFFSGFFLSLCFYTKAEVFFALLAAECISLFFLAYAKRTNKTNIFVFFFGFSFATFLFALLFSFLSQVHIVTFFKAFLSSYLLIGDANVTAMDYYRNLMGTTNVNIYTHFIFMIFGFSIFVALPHFLLEKNSFKNNRSSKRLLAYLSLLFLILNFISQDISKYTVRWETLTPFLCFALFCYLAHKSIKRTPVQHSNLLILFSSFAFLLTLKVLFWAWSIHYGFVLVLPASLLVSLVLMEKFQSTIFANSWRLYIVSLLLGPTLYLQIVTMSYTKAKDALLTTDRLTIHLDSAAMVPMQALNTALNSRYKSARTLAVLPEGLLFNFLSGKISPLPFISLLPDQVIHFGVNTILASLKASQPDLLLVYPRPVGEFGMGNFRTGYGKEIYAWMKLNYHHDESASDLETMGIEIFMSQAFWNTVEKK